MARGKARDKARSKKRARRSNIGTGGAYTGAPPYPPYGPIVPSAGQYEAFPTPPGEPAHGEGWDDRYAENPRPERIAGTPFETWRLESGDWALYAVDDGTMQGRYPTRAVAVAVAHDLMAGRRVRLGRFPRGPNPMGSWMDIDPASKHPPGEPWSEVFNPPGVGGYDLHDDPSRKSVRLGVYQSKLTLHEAEAWWRPLVSSDGRKSGALVLYWDSYPNNAENHLGLYTPEDAKGYLRYNKKFKKVASNPEESLHAGGPYAAEAGDYDAGWGEYADNPYPRASCSFAKGIGCNAAAVIPFADPRWCWIHAPKAIRERAKHERDYRHWHDWNEQGVCNFCGRGSPRGEAENPREGGRPPWCGDPWWAKGKRYHVVGWHKRFDHSDVMAAYADETYAKRVAAYLKDTSTSHENFHVVDMGEVADNPGLAIVGN